MLIELLCPKCKGPLEIDNEMKVGTCPFCGTKSLITDSIPNKVDIQLPEINRQRSEQLTEHSYLMLMQGNKQSAIDSINEALRLDPDNTSAWILYSAITMCQLKPEVKKRLDLEKGLPMAKDLLSFDKKLSPMIYSIYPELDERIKPSNDRMIKWTDITDGSSLTISFEYKCKKKNANTIHYYNWEKDGLELVQGLNTLSLKSGIHLFVNSITEKYLIIAIPNIGSGVPQYFCSPYSNPIFKAKGINEFKRWNSDADYMIVNSFIVDEETKERVDVNCEGMEKDVKPLL